MTSGTAQLLVHGFVGVAVIAAVTVLAALGKIGVDAIAPLLTAVLGAQAFTTLKTPPTKGGD